MREILLRIIIGGAVVSAFALLGDLLKPRRFAGLFGAAPSVGLATLTLAVLHHGRTYAGVEARSMVVGAVGFLVYASVAGRLMIRKKWPALPVTAAALLVWLGATFGLWYGLMS